ncbi:MAG: hypothetical protein IH956_07435 [Chloroflexi bacterium]|nr:hypothetical protein [Chloroflexota bacterium]
MAQGNGRNIASASWGDHLAFGEADGLLDSPDKLRRSMAVWRDELGAGIVHWRHGRRTKKGRYYAAPEYRKAVRRVRNHMEWDDFDVVPKMAHELDMKAYVYVSLFAEGWPLAPRRVRAVSHHNAMHGQHFAWQSHFSRANPEYVAVDRTGERRQWGVLCLGYPEVREYLRTEFLGLLGGYEWDGLFVCLRTEARPADFADQFGFNEPVRRDYRERYGRDIAIEDFDVHLWRDLLGGYLTTFLAELRAELPDETRLAVGCARGDVLGPPLGNATLHWPQWVERGLVDDLVIDQSSSQCPSMWHQLWPMHRGYGYVQNYHDGHNMPALEDHLRSYASVMQGHATRLYVARQWSERSESEEAGLLGLPGVAGLAFSTFRHDNPGPLARGNWVVGPDTEE